MSAIRKFTMQNGPLVLTDGIALYLSINARDEIATRQLLREYEISYPSGYGKQVLVKTVALLDDAAKYWLRELY
jgi:hypothetical protein